MKSDKTRKKKRKTMSTPYIGSKISLISKSEIRYEGILYTVDPAESTIALAKVRTFGTENRTTEHPTPPRDEIFEYIIFKATDIKDIVVCETPQPAPQLYDGLPYDPAIVSVSKVGSKMVRSETNNAAASSDDGQRNYERNGQQQQRNNSNSGGGGGGGYIPRGGSSMRGGSSASGPPTASGSSYRRDGQPRYDGDYDFETANERFQETLNHLKDEFSTKVKCEDNNAESSIDDYADVNAHTANTSVDDEDKLGYNKSKSFFDHISCEALERMEGSGNRPNWRRERELNQETFGQSGFRNYRYKRGGVGRGGRGGYRRGGYYGGGSSFGGGNRF